VPPLSSLGRRLGGALLDGVLMIVTLIIGWVIWSLIVWSDGRSPGKQLLGMRVYKYDTRRPAGWGDMFVREFLVAGVLLYVLGFFTFGLAGLIATLLIFGGTLRQTGWDRICGTVVVDDR
jgi:uncharacterized RDD family membrane protein YckC